MGSFKQKKTLNFCPKMVDCVVHQKTLFCFFLSSKFFFFFRQCQVSAGQNASTLTFLGTSMLPSANKPRCCNKYSGKNRRK